MSQNHEQGRPMPLHRYIAEKIRQDIVHQGLAPHTKIPSEVDLANQYHVSRGTIMKALASLVQEGICYRLRPQGTFVAHIPEEPVPEEVNTVASAQAGLSPQSPPPILGLIVPYLSSTFLSSIVVSVETAARIAGCTLSLAYTEFDWGLEQYHINQFLRQGVSGIILYPGDHGVEWCNDRYVSLETTGRLAMLQMLQHRGVPFVLLDRYIPEVDCDYVVNDDRVIGYTATQHLVTLGHQRIGFISIYPPITSSAERYAGYTDCLHAHALLVEESDVLQSLCWSFVTSPSGERLPDIDQAGYHAIRTYLQREDRPSAVVVLNDTVAWGVIKVAEEIGLRVPDELAVVCCGGGNPEVYGRIPLTSITQLGTELGRQGAYLLLDRIEGRSSVTRHITLSSNLVVRRSCGAYLGKIPGVGNFV